MSPVPGGSDHKILAVKLVTILNGTCLAGIHVIYGTVSRIIALVIFLNFQDKQKKSNANIEMYG